MEVITAILGLLDGTLMALVGQPVLSLLLMADVFFAVLGLFLMIKEAAGGRRRNGR